MAKKPETKSDDRPPRKDVLLLKLDEINIEENFNVRQDYGDLNELARSIESNGVRVPLRGHKKGGKYILTDGHRRFKAAQMLAEKGIEIRVPFLSDGRESSAEQRVIDMLICNEGKKLNPVEESEAIARLVNFGWSDTEISTKTGYTKVYICNLKLLQSAPKKIKELITGNVVSATLAMSVLRKEKDFDKAQKAIENAVQFGAETGKNKITAKDLRQSEGKTNSYSALKKVMKVADKKDLVVRQDKIEIFEFVQKLNSGEYTEEALMSEIYEPEAE